MAIPIKDCGEQLVNLKKDEPHIFAGDSPPKLQPYVASGMWVRQGVRDRIVEAQRLLTTLNSDLTLLVCYGYRHPEIQKNYFETYREQVTREHPEWSKLEVLEYTHHYLAIPEVAGHPAGAAIDLTIVDEKKASIDMGSTIGQLIEIAKVPTVSPGLTEEQQDNRLLLREIMTLAGFAPYDFEWWHFSYGDREWACYYNQPNAIYGEIEFRC